MRIFFVHGIHATRKSATAQLAREARKWLKENGRDDVEVIVHNYGMALALPRAMGNWINNRRAKELAAKMRDGDCIVAHSNGCTLAYLVQRDHRKLDGLVLFQPALDNDAVFTGCDRVMVIYNERDDVVEQSRWALFSSWGNMGRVGYKGPSKNVEQADSMNPPSLPPLPYSGHCGFVENGLAVLASWAAFAAEWITNNKE